MMHCDSINYFFFYIMKKLKKIIKKLIRSKLNQGRMCHISNDPLGKWMFRFNIKNITSIWTLL